MDKLLRTAAVARGLCILASCAGLMASPVEAGGKKKKSVRTPAVFDIATRKSTRKDWGLNVKGSAYASLKLSRRTNLVRDDNADDRSEKVQAYFGLAARADLGMGVVAFGHAEFALKHTETSSRSYGFTQDLNIKEALISVPMAQDATLSFGRMRFKDADKWVLDSAVDGVHFGLRRGYGHDWRGLDLALVRGTGTAPSNHAIAHVWRMSLTHKSGAFVIAEAGQGGDRLHLSGYYSQKTSGRLSWHINGAAVFGDLAGGESAGVGFDLRATRKFKGKRNPQVTFGLAMGSTGFQQSGLHSNKTYDGGQTQMHRYGEVFRPELTNLVVGTLSWGLRPSKRFSVNVTAHAYARVSLNGPAPDARFDGLLNTHDHFLGSEINVAGAWRPTRKSKVEFGAGRFMPGPAYTDRSASTRVFARYTMTF